MLPAISSVSSRYCSAPPLPNSTSKPFLGFSRRNLTISKLSASPTDFPPASRIFVRNLSYSTSESSLKNEFSNFGQILEVKLVKDEARKRSKGCAFIQYASQDDAMLAIEHMDHMRFDGRVVYVEIAKPVSNPSTIFPKTSGPPAKM